MKLINGFLIMAKLEGVVDHTPDRHHEWYRLSGITKKTFVATVRSYDNFRCIVKQYLLQDLSQFIKEQDALHVGEDFVAKIIRFMSVTSSNQKKRQKQLEFQQEMKYATYALSNSDWTEILAPALNTLKEEASTLLDEETLHLSFLRWAATVKEVLKQWFIDDLDIEKSDYYKDMLRGFLNEIPAEIRKMEQIKSRIKQERLARMRKPKDPLAGIPEDSWYRKELRKEAG